MTEPARAVADEWWSFEQRLGQYLGALLDGEAVVLAVSETERYVQFMSFGRQGIRGEVSYDPASEAAARALGWRLPARNDLGRSTSGTDNLEVEVPPAEVHLLARMAVGRHVSGRAISPGCAPDSSRRCPASRVRRRPCQAGRW
ncbi:hypothetical protein BH20ACT6_BH20ACT6_21400 [soil metagenome]